MAKKATKSSADAPVWMKPKFEGQKFCLAGRFEKYAWRLTKPDLESYVRNEGGTVVDSPDATCHFLVMNELTGSSGHEKKVAQLNAKGASISVISAQQLHDMIVPLPSEVEEMLRAGTDGHVRLTACLATAKMTSDSSGRTTAPFTISGLSLKGQSVENIPLWCVSQDRADLREIQLPEHDKRGSYYCFGPLMNSKLDKARLHAWFASLVDCSCRDADLSGSWLGGFNSNARCRSDFTKANLARFHFSKTDCSDSTFAKADLTSAFFEQAKVHNADFSGACLKELRAKHADFTGCNFSKADFTGADLNDAKFDNCNLSGAKFSGALMSSTSMKNAVLSGADFADANVATVNFDGSDISKAKNLRLTVSAPKTAGPKLTELSDLVKAADSFESSIEVQHGQLTVRLKYQYRYKHHHASWSKQLWADTLSDWSTQPKSAADGFLAAIGCWPEATALPHTVSVSGKGMKMPQAKLRQLALEAWCESFGIPVPDAAEMAKLASTHQESKNDERAQVLAILDQPNGVEQWNERNELRWRELNPYIDFDLSDKNLSTIDLGDIEFENCRFDNCSMADADLEFSSYRRSRFCKANMTGLKARHSHFEECDFSGADLTKASLSGSHFHKASFTDATLVDANLAGADLRAANFKGAKLSSDSELWTSAVFDESTAFPKGFKVPDNMKWKGKGNDPRAEKALKAAKTKGPIDIEQFMQLLQSSVDKDRLKKATSMLKAERFRLFAQAADDHLEGVVKSQNDPDLVYSCRLTKDGNYACCTQNLNICGGLRGAL